MRRPTWPDDATQRPAERIRLALTVLLEQLDAEPDLARLCVVEALKAGPAVSERRARTELTGALMAMIVHPCLGSAAAQRELKRPIPKTPTVNNGAIKDPFKDLSIRFTYRTARVLATIAAEGRRGSHPSNRVIADTSGISDEGQMSRLLMRLQRAGLIENHTQGQAKGEANAWLLTKRGEAVQEAIGGKA
jgi:hypothetical protein